MTRFINEGGKAPDCIKKIPKEIQEQPAPTKWTAQTELLDFYDKLPKVTQKETCFPLVWPNALLSYGEESMLLFFPT